VDDQPPYRSYAVIMGGFAAGLAGAGALARRFDRPYEGSRAARGRGGCGGRG